MSVAAEALTTLAAAMLERLGCPPEEAREVADHLVEADLQGHASHGVVRLPRYVDWVRRGWLIPGRPPEVVVDGAAFLVVDGGFGFGQMQGRRATEMGIARARRHGVALVALRRAGHLGRIGRYAEQAVAAGLVSIHFVNVAGSRLVAPFGARERRVSTNPLAIGIPSGDDRPFVLDFATSVVAEGKLLVALESDRPVREDALVDAEGRPTGDPRALYGERRHPFPDPARGRGALRPFGEHKGSGLALACELLAGALTGSGTNVRPLDRIHNGMLSIFVDPARLGDSAAFLAEVRAFLDWVRAARPVDPVTGTRVPGDPERETAARRRAHGIPLARPLGARLAALARELGVDAELVRTTLGEAP